MFIKLKDAEKYLNLSGDVLMEFLKQNITTDGKAKKEIEIRKYVPFLKSEATEQENNCYNWIYSSFDVDRGVSC